MQNSMKIGSRIRRRRNLTVSSLPSLSRFFIYSQHTCIYFNKIERLLKIWIFLRMSCTLLNGQQVHRKEFIFNIIIDLQFFLLVHLLSCKQYSEIGFEDIYDTIIPSCYAGLVKERSRKDIDPVNRSGGLRVSVARGNNKKIKKAWN